MIALLTADNAPLPARPYFESGDPGPLVAAWAQVPELLGVTLPFVGTVLGPSSIGIRPKELCILRTSALLECRYCVDSHTEAALDVGLDPEEVRALRNETPIEAVFSDPAELALLAWIDAVALGPGQPSDELAEAMTRNWEDHEVVELTLLIGATLMLNRFATSLRLPTSAPTVTNLRTLGFPSTQPAIP